MLFLFRAIPLFLLLLSVFLLVIGAGGSSSSSSSERISSTPPFYNAQHDSIHLSVNSSSDNNEKFSNTHQPQQPISHSQNQKKPKPVKTLQSKKETFKFNKNLLTDDEETVKWTY